MSFFVNVLYIDLSLNGSYNLTP